VYVESLLVVRINEKKRAVKLGKFVGEKRTTDADRNGFVVSVNGHSARRLRGPSVRHVYSLLVTNPFLSASVVVCGA